MVLVSIIIIVLILLLKFKFEHWWAKRLTIVTYLIGCKNFNLHVSSSVHGAIRLTYKCCSRRFHFNTLKSRLLTVRVNILSLRVTLSPLTWQYGSQWPQRCSHDLWYRRLLANLFLRDHISVWNRMILVAIKLTSECVCWRIKRKFNLNMC